MAFVAPTPPTTPNVDSVTPSRRGLDVATHNETTPQPERVKIGDEFWAYELTEPDQVALVSDEWKQLVAHTAEPNAFLEDWMFEPAWRAFGDPTSGGDAVTVVMVFHRGKATQCPPVPIGLFPCVVSNTYGPLAGEVLTNWQHPYCFDTTPLLRKGWTVAAVQTYFAWAEQRRPSCGLIHFPNISDHGPFSAALNEWSRACRAPSFAIDRWNRAMLMRGNGYESYIDEAISPSTRRELRRQTRRLADIGVVETTVTTEAPSVDAWVERFLDLESKGWKEDSSIAQDETHADYFRKIAREAANTGLFEGLEMTLDSRPIAMKCNFYSSPTEISANCQAGVGFKIAYDETFKKFSPGNQLELKMIRRFHEDTSALSVDSCAKPGHPMIDRFWSGRTARADLLFASNGLRASLVVGGMTLARWLRRSFRRSPQNLPRVNF